MKIAKSTKNLIRSILLVCVICVVAGSFYSVINRIAECKDRISVLNEQINAEKEKNKELNEIKSQIHSDENYKDIARDALGLVNPGDKVYVNSNNK